MPTEVHLSQAIEAFQRGDLDSALRLAEQSRPVSPSPAWHHLVGLIHCRRGNPGRGVEYLRRAADADSANIGFQVMLARALIDSGDGADVLRREKPSANPTSADLPLWLVRAEAADVTGNAEAAAEAWTAVATCRRTDAEAWTNLARSLFALKRWDEAEAACRAALAISPHDVTVIQTVGLIYERSNRLDELDVLLERSLRVGIKEEQLSYLWALREQRAGHLQDAREHLLRSDPSEDPVRWHRLRIKIADGEGDVAAAFDSMTAMNCATPGFQVWRERGAAFRLDLRRLASAMTSEWANRIPPLGASREGMPVFMVGLPRSGTTLLDTFLMGHSSIHVVEEKEILRRAGQTVSGISQLSGCSEASLDRARQAYLDELRGYVEPDFTGTVIDKNPFNMLLAPFIDTLFHGAPVIFSKRHPCDAVLSGFMQSYIPNIGMASFLDLADAADLYDAAMTLWTASIELFPLNVHTVAYENLIEDPERQLRSVIGFLGLEWDDGVMDHRATATARGALTNTSYDQITQPLTSGAVGRWRRYEKQLEPVLPVLLPWARRLGYQD